MLNFIAIVLAIVVAQFTSMAIAFALFKNRAFMKWLSKWALDYMNICQEVIDEMEEAE